MVKFRVQLLTVKDFSVLLQLARFPLFQQTAHNAVLHSEIYFSLKSNKLLSGVKICYSYKEKLNKRNHHRKDGLHDILLVSSDVFDLCSTEAYVC